MGVYFERQSCGCVIMSHRKVWDIAQKNCDDPACVAVTETISLNAAHTAQLAENKRIRALAKDN
jgi:hypothetical protein